MERQKKSPSPERKGVGRKDKERLKQVKRLQLQQQRLERLKQQADIQLSKLKSTGIVHAYESFLRSILANGFPQQSILYEKAAQFIIKYEKKMKKRVEIQQYPESKPLNALRKSRSKSNSQESITRSLPKMKMKRQKSKKRV